MPAKTYVGDGATEELPGVARQFRAKSVFIFTDRGVQEAGLVAPLVEGLSREISEISVFRETEPEPTVENIERASQALAKARGVDVLISIGGGSAIDTAKCANIVHMNGDSILNYEDGIAERREVARLLPHIAIPTTAGTGSEATIWAMFIDPKRRCKTGVRAPGLIADAVILDPQMTRTMPPEITAATGMDALTHAIEAYVCVSANPVTEAFCLRAIELIGANLKTVVRDGDNIEARTDMLLASYMAGSAFSNSSLGIVHTLAETLGGYYRIPHGVTNTLMLPHVMEFNRSSRPEKFAKIALAMGSDITGLDPEEASSKSLSTVKRLTRAIGLPGRLREVGVRKEDFPELVKMAFKWANLSGNPREVTQDQVRNLYEEAF